jgi:hypothetical protein
LNIEHYHPDGKQCIKERLRQSKDSAAFNSQISCKSSAIKLALIAEVQPIFTAQP